MDSSKDENRRTDGAIVVALDAAVNELKADELIQMLRKLFDDGKYMLILDMSRTQFISSTGLGGIMMAHRECTANGGYVFIVNPQPLIRDILQVTKLDSILKVFPTLEEAERAAGGQ